MKSVLLLTLAFSSFSFAQINKSGIRAATSRAEFCNNAKNPNYFKSLLYSNDNLIAFGNRGGIGGGGVCWWHSMLTRSVQFLTVYKPDLAKPDREMAKKIVEWISTEKGVVEIPGYRNFSEFSRDYADIIQASLERAQIGDGGLGFGFARGLSGSHNVEPAVLEKMMDDTYKLVTGKKQVVYQKLQIEGIEAHAWLVVDMIKTANGYSMDVVDSNTGGVRTAQYIRGSTQLADYKSVPYTSRNLFSGMSFDSAISSYCRQGTTAADLAYGESTGF